MSPVGETGAGEENEEGGAAKTCDELTAILIPCPLVLLGMRR